MSRRFEVTPETPQPIRTRVVHIAMGPTIVTGIMRHWSPGDSGPEGRCHLCPKCHAYDDGCLILVGEGIARKDAPFFEMHSRSEQVWVKRIPPERSS